MLYCCLSGASNRPGVQFREFYRLKIGDKLILHVTETLVHAEIISCAAVAPGELCTESLHHQSVSISNEGGGHDVQLVRKVVTAQDCTASHCVLSPDADPFFVELFARRTPGTTEAVLHAGLATEEGKEITVMIREPDGVPRPNGLRLASKPSANKRKEPGSALTDGFNDDTTLRYTGKVSATSYIARRAALVDGLSVGDAVETSFTDERGQCKKYRRYGPPGDSAWRLVSASCELHSMFVGPIARACGWGYVPLAGKTSSTMC
jgi:hypothetical protein